MSNVHHLLLISYYFPPDGGAGTQRAAKLCKYLPDFGWRITVVTRPVEHARGRWDPEDTEMTGDIASSSVNVVRCTIQRSRELKNPAVGLESFAVCCEEVIRRDRPDIICITMSPFELADLRILQRKFGVPVVLDLRDPWAFDGWKSYRHIFQWVADKRRMKRALSEAAGVIMNTPEAAKSVLEAFPGTSSERLTSIGNGYDATDFGSIVKIDDNDERFTIVHCGTLHSYIFRPVRTWKQHASLLVRFRSEPIRPEGRTLKYLCGALERLKDRNPALLRELRVVLVGPYDEDTKAYLEQSRVQEFFQPLGYLNHSETMRWIKRADALFLPMHGLPPKRRSLMVPGKTYEYLASGKPILAAVPDGDAKDLLLRCPSAVIVDPCDSEELAWAILKLLSRVKPCGSTEILSVISPFRREKIASQFSRFFLHIMSLMEKALPASEDTQDLVRTY